MAGSALRTLCGRDVRAPSGLLLSSFLGTGLIATITAPNSIQHSVGLDLVSNESAARAADSYGHVVALLNTDAFGVVAPREPIETACEFDCECRFVFFAVGILSRGVVHSFKRGPAGARRFFTATVVHTPVAQLAINLAF